MMQKHPKITLERLELLNDGKCYLASDNISILSQVYSEKQAIGNISVWRNTERFIDFSDVLSSTHFEPTKVGDSFGPTWSTHWFKVEFALPAHWKSQEVHLLWDSSSEATLWSSDGHILQGFNGSNGDDRRAEFILSRPDIHPHDLETSYIFYVEMACNEMFGAGQDGMIQPPNPEKNFSLRICELGIFQREIWNLYCDFRILFDAAKTLPKESPRAQDALFIANRICNVFSPLDPESWKKCRELAAEYLKHKNGTSNHRVTAIGHCHIDTAWLWPYAETRRKCARSWATALEYMKYHDSSTYRFCASSAQQYDWVRADYPELFQRIQSKVQQQQFQVVGGTWVEFDGNIPSGESISRQFLYGQSFFKKYFHQRCNVFFMPDTFGYCAQLPQIMKQSGIEYFITQKLSWNLINKFPHTTFRWQGIDGTKVLTHFPPADTYNSNARLDQLYKSFSNNKDLDRTSSSLMLFGHGDGGGGPKYEMIEMLQRMKDLQGVPNVVIQPVDKFFTELEENARDICTWNGELYLELHRGTYTTQAWVKRYNRKCELLLRECEFLGTIRNLLSESFNYPKEKIEYLWKLVLLNQFHDVLPGTSIGLVYQDSMKHYSEVLSEGNDFLEKNLPLLAFNDQDSKLEDNILLLNSLSWEREVLVETNSKPLNGISQSLSNGKFLTATNVNSCGISELKSIETVACTIREFEGEYHLENRFTRVRIDSCGNISSFWNKEAERELIGKRPGNLFVLYEDIPFFWDAWDIMVYHLETRKEIQQTNLQISMEEIGPLRVSLIVQFSFGSGSSVKQRISLSSNSPLLEFETFVTWKEQRKLLKVEFPTEIVSPMATYEIQYGHLQRPTHFNTTWDLAKFEVCGHRWADLSEFDFGLAILNDCKYSYSIHGSVISLTLLKAPKAPDLLCDQGDHQFTYAMYAHTGTFQQARVVQLAYELNAPVQVFRAKNLLNRSFFNIDKPNVILDCVKMAEDDSCIVVRLYDAFGGACVIKFTIGFPVRQVFACNFLEDNQQEISVEQDCNSTHFVTLPFKTFEVRSLKIVQ